MSRPLGTAPHRVAPRALAALFVVTLAVFLLTAQRSGGHMDFWTSNYASWHLVQTGTPWIEGVSIPGLDDNPRRFVWVSEPAPNGHTVIGRSPGTIAVTLPAYALIGSETMTLLPAAVTAALVAALSVLLLSLALSTALRTREVIVAAAVFAFATPVWTVAADGLWPHTVTVVGITGMAWGAATGRAWLVGLFGGVTLWGRLHAAIIVAIMGLAWGARRRSLRIPLVVGALSGASLIAMCGWCRWMYGTWDPTSAYDFGLLVEYADRNRFDVVNFLGFWVSPDRGLVVWTPLLLLLAPAVVRAWRTLPAWSTSLLLGGVGYTLVQAALNRFSGGDYFYGYRLTLELLACSAPALALSAHRVGRRARPLLGPVIGLQFCAMLVGAVTKRYWVHADAMWTDNAFWMAARDLPHVVVPVAVVCMAAGAVLQRRLFPPQRALVPSTGIMSSHSVP